jgi:phosphinothricin acetyltransferase
MTQLEIRDARADDLPALVRIYNHFVEHTPVTFHTEQFDVRGRQDWFDSFSENGPHRLLVAEQDAEIAGYASSARFKARAAYDTSVETTIYLDPSAAGRGIGSRLYAQLVDLLVADERLHRAYGGVALPNPASVALHERCGFKAIGTYREVGFKFGKYWDVAWFERDLS